MNMTNHKKTATIDNIPFFILDLISWNLTPRQPELSTDTINLKCIHIYGLLHTFMIFFMFFMVSSSFFLAT